MTSYQNPEMVALFETYTAGPTSIGANLTRAAIASDSGAPLLVATGTDMALYPGNGQPPSVESFRLSTQGFKELTSISHLGPAMATLVNMRALDPSSGRWRSDAERLLAAIRTARAANSVELWRERIAVEAYRGREAAIATMIDYSCAIATRWLEAVLADDAKLTPEFLREAVLEASSDALGASVPLNRMLVATFFLAGLDISFRIMRWFGAQAVRWREAMVLICGEQGRPTAGVTWTSNSVAQMILAASNHQLPLERLYIAPFGPSFTLQDPNDLDEVKWLEKRYRSLWSYTRAICDLGPTMFEGYPRYTADAYKPPVITDRTTELSEMPAINGPDDWRTMTTRLRLVIEDPRQLLSGCITDYAAEQLRANGNDPRGVIVPGLDGVDYPTGL